ncbi:sensor histidine kinase [Stieleria varia]|uniref:histidine kinase n=1 Tax=Stieleria varia TaxID=2528005 RepID=A0A5C6AME5_9BACT|nr:HAMP domain-containing sensor histidine kinase [Stieleria varia]TWU00830.1 Sensor protein ZraS [Stieleria varia]
MGLYPCLRHGENRWWLPLGEDAHTVIGRLLLAPPQVPSHVRSAVIELLQSDPTFFLYAALQFSSDTAGLEDLADWWIENARGRFASGDAFLGAPDIVVEHKQRWRKLHAHYAAIAHNDWMRDAPLWLEVLGPPVPLSWHQHWPEIEFDAEVMEAEASPLDSGIFLQQLARQTQRAESLQAAFDERLHRAKLGSLKQLAYGLSHEINNPLANISTRAQQLQREESDPQRHAVLQRIVDQVYRAHEMIADLMFYANPPMVNPVRLDLVPLVADVLPAMQSAAEVQRIRIEFQQVVGSAWVSGDRSMIGEAVRGLVRNAAEAIGQRGTIIVSVEQEGERFQIRVADSGPGLSARDREHAFDPYYSGREAGRGLGLGLCRVYRVARLHQGDVALTTGPTGCVATLTLPIAKS